MLVGLVASGKTTYAYKLAEEIGAAVIDSDEYRKILFGDDSDQSDNAKLFQYMHEVIKKNLKDGNNVVFSATNLSSKRRRSFLNELTKIPCEKKCVVMATPIDKCRDNNNSRNMVVKQHVIDKMYHSFNTPQWYEGWDEIIITYWDNCRRWDTRDFVYDAMDTNQNNPHHRFSLGGHLSKCMSNYLESVDAEHYDSTLAEACLLHDNGKVYTKTFMNSRGELGDIAHYYSHENVGAYEALFCKPLNTDVDILKLSQIINLHMYPYAFEHEERNGNYKMRERYKKLWGEELYNNIMTLYAADVNAH